MDGGFVNEEGRFDVTFLNIPSLFARSVAFLRNILTFLSKRGH